MLLSSVAWAQGTVTGTVVDDSGLGLPGVNVIVVGTSSGTVTDLDGTYSITADADATLRYSYIGFAAQEIPVDGQAVINVTLGNDAGLLDEVVVLGYGSQNRESVTGAISSVGGETLSEITTPSLGEALQGRLAGVQVIAGGAPGEAPQVQVRGIGSISFGSGPLIVVDGIPSAGGYNQFDTRDIESTTVLKDASSTAIYGSRASNGVILITTKSGSKNSPIRLGFETTVGVQTQNKRYETMSTPDYLRYAEIISGNPVARDLNEIAPGTNLAYRDIDVDYQDELFQDGLMTQNSLNISGGGERSSFYSSFGYFKQEGIIVGGGYERYNFRINSKHDLSANGKFRFGQTLLLVNDDRQLEEGNLLVNAVQSIPYLPSRNPNNIGGFNGAQQGLDSADPRNPLLAALFIQNNNRVFKTLGTAFLEYDLLEGLTAKVLFGANYSVFRGYNQQPIYQSTVSRDLNQITEERSTDYSPLYQAQLSYDRILGDHTINATLVGEIQENYGYYVRVQGNQTTNEINVVLGAKDIVGQSNRTQGVLQSFLGRATYGYLGRYLLTVSFRRDGSSIFAPGNNTEIFPAAALAWRISEEGFMQNTAVSTLKLRASYGRTGSIGLGAYTFQAPVICSQGAVVGGESPVIGCYIDALENRELSWEITDMANIGIDVGFLNNRLNFSAEYYDRQVDNLILDVPIAPSLGPDGTSQNVGAMSNTGIEFQGEYISNRSNAFRWEVSANVSSNTNEVKRLAVEDGEILLGQNQVGQGFTSDLPPTITRVGDPVFSFYGFKTDGLFRTQQELENSPFQENAAVGDVKFVDTNGDNVINNDDRVIIGKYLPDFTYGFTFKGYYSNFDASLFFAGSQGNDIYNGFASLLSQTQRLFNGSPDRLNGFSPENQDTDIPRIALNDPNRNRRMSDRFLEDGSYLRLRNVTLGYTVPFGEGAAVSKLRVYLSAQNLFTLTGYSGLDPEIGQISQGLVGFDNGRYPQAKTFLIGAQVGF
ncbi:SusC/RagA family TonB-linked outer membrane protein [Neolewinella sp.]|uniref:SusC/RagA family TonB-linked outer membrane protein n=1 Tax=Neolewinella sp. TaxID=2993543 RepID=UPI003B518645